MPPIRVPTLGEIERAFRDDVAERCETLRSFVDQDVLGLDAIAAVLARACRAIEPLYRGLDAARLVESGGRNAPQTFHAAEVDAYALVEGLMWGKLAGTAEALLKAQLQHAFDHPDAPASRAKPLVASFDEGSVQ